MEQYYSTFENRAFSVRVGNYFLICWTKLRMLGLWRLTLCLDNNFGEKRKEKGKEGKRNEKGVTVVCLGGKGREMSFPFIFSNFKKIETLIKIIHLIPPHPFCLIFLSKKGISHPSKSYSFRPNIA